MRLRRTLVIPVLIVAILVPASPASADTQGSIALGMQGGWSCFYSPNCLLFTMSDCDETFAQRENGVSSSIVDVGEMGSGDTGEVRTLRTHGEALGDGSTLYGITFYSSTCQRLEADPPLPAFLFSGVSIRFTVPTEAKWIVISVQNAALFSWSLKAV